MGQGKSWGRYVLERRLALGGMAEIYVGRLNTDGFHKQVCIKKVLPHHVEDEAFVAMFRDEAALAARLQHANIVQVFDFGDVDGELFLAMEFVDGADLRRLNKASKSHNIPPSISQCCQLVIEICRGLHYAHTVTLEGKSLGIVHRDISPHNVLISRNGEVKIADFGDIES